MKKIIIISGQSKYKREVSGTLNCIALKTKKNTEFQYECESQRNWIDYRMAKWNDEELKFVERKASNIRLLSMHIILGGN